MEKKTYTISVYTENNIGVLNRLSAIFLKIQKVVKQLEKQIEVVAAYFHTNGDIIYQETAMFKMRTEHLFDEEIQSKLKQRRINIVTVTKTFFVIETTGTSEEIDQLYDVLKKYNLLQFVRSGVIAITRPRMAISERLAEYQS